MIKTLLLLTALALVQARPSDDAEPINGRIYEVHEDCPPAEVHFLLPHEYDCTKFYYCEYGLKWIEPRNCAPGTEFNAEIQVCVHPSSSGCTLPGVSTSPEDGTTVTVSGTTWPTSTEGTIAPSPTTEPAPNTEPTIPEIVTTELTTPEIATPEPTTPEIVTPGPTTPGPTIPEEIIPEVTTPAVAPSTSVPNPDDCETLDNGCPADFTIHKLIPHEEYCHKFYYCDKGELVLRYCAPGTYFNPKLEVCDWPHNVDCVNDGSYEYPTTSAPETQPPSPPGDGDNDIGDVLDNGCPADFDVHHLLPHETECNKFYYCVFGEKVERSCAPGTYFNYEIQVCDWPFNVNCSSTGTTPGGSPDDPISSEEIPIVSDPEDPQDPIDWVPLPNGCPADFGIHHLLPHESDCNKFYYCVDGQILERECPSGTHFSPSKQICDWPQYAGCEHWDSGCTGPGDGNGDCTAAPGGNDGTTAAPGGNDGTTAAPGSNDGTTAAPGGNDGTTAAPGVNDGTTAAPGGNDGTTAAPEDPIDWVPLPNGCPADFDVHHLLPHEYDCNKFYYCDHGQILERECPPGTHFSPSQQICDWPQYAGCEHWDGGCTGPGDDNGGCAGTTAAPGGNDGTTAAPGGNDGTTAAPGGNDGTTSAPGGNDLTTAAPGGNDGTTAAPGGNDGTTAAPGGNDGTTAAPGGNDLTTAAPGGNDGTTAAPGGNDGTTAAPGGNDLTTATAAPIGTDGTTAAPGGNDGTTAAPDCDACRPITPAEKCKSGCNVLPFVHDNDCDKYWICNGEQPLLVTCSEGLHFNPSTYTCDFICNAGCLRENVQITTLAEGVKLFLPWGSITSEMMSLLDAELNAEL